MNKLKLIQNIVRMYTHEESLPIQNRENEGEKWKGRNPP